MTMPRITFLVHGGADSIEAVRARGLTRDYTSDRLRILLREGSRADTARRWRADLRDHPPQLVYVVSTALPGSLLALERRLTRRIPYVLDTGDVIYEMARRSGVNAGWKLPALRLVEGLAQRGARAVVVRGTRHRDYLSGVRGLKRVAVLRDGYELGPPPSPVEVAALRDKLGLGGSFVVGVTGSLVYSPRLQICYGWDLVRALAQLRDVPVRGLVVGDGPGRPWLEREAAELGVADRVVFVGRVPHREVGLHLQLMDVAMSTQTDNLPGQVRTTAKLPEYMAASRFILASRVGEAELVLPEPMLVDYEGEVDSAYPGRIAERVRALVREPEALDARLTLPALAEELFSYDVLSAQFNELIESL
jgi:glycosyltransferase involved in cell wall biosynthesis